MTIKNVKLYKALEQEGIKGELVRSEGYFYFVSDNGEVGSGIYIYRFNECTIGEWVELIKDSLNN